MTIPEETLAWLRQSASTEGAAYSQVLLHVLERLEGLEAKYETQRLATLEWGKDVDMVKRWSDDHLRRLEALEQPHQDKMDRLIEQDFEDDEPTPEAAPVATDEELQCSYSIAVSECINSGAASWELSKAGRRAVYNLGRQHGAAQAHCPHIQNSDENTSYCALAEQTAAAQPTPPAAHDPTDAAPLLWILWNHQGSRSPEGQAIRKYLGMGQYESMSDLQIGAANQYRELLSQPAPPAAPAGGLVERVAMAANCYPHENARIAIREVAAWLSAESYHATAERLLKETDR